MKSFRDLKVGDFIWAVKWDKYDAKRIQILDKETVFKEKNYAQVDYIEFKIDKSYFNNVHWFTVDQKFIEQSCLDINSNFICLEKEDAIKLLKSEEEDRLRTAMNRYYNCERIIECPGSSPSKVRMYSKTIENTTRRILEIEDRYQKIYDSL